MNYVGVSSSNIAAIAYDDAGRILGVQFIKTGEYWYHGVPRSVYESFLGASSKGCYFDAFVKPMYVYTRVG